MPRAAETLSFEIRASIFGRPCRSIVLALDSIASASVKRARFISRSSSAISVSRAATRSASEGGGEGGEGETFSRATGGRYHAVSLPSKS